MIKKIELEGYRCYEKHKIEFKNLSIVVGKNNAGKSTLIEALRLIALISNRYKNLNYKNPPRWSKLPRTHKGAIPSLKNIEISFKSIFHNYSSTLAKITVFFEENSKIELFIGENEEEQNKEIFAVIFNEEGKVIKDKGMARTLELPKINILPQIGPLKEEEPPLEEDYVKSNIYSSLASSHFRNQLQYFNQYYKNFTELSERTWKELRIRSFTKGSKIPGREKNPLLQIDSENFSTEIGWVGHGLQMWLQTMWFIARCQENSIVILDEPDVYLHADIQRKLIRFLKGKFAQTIVATHSIEIISEVEPENVLLIDKNEKESKYMTSLPAVQNIIENMGSFHNLELIRIWALKRYLIFEGPNDDLKILGIIQNKIFPKSDIPFNTIPKTYCGGWAGWKKILGSKIKNVEIYCIFDSDYHTETKKKERYEEAKQNKINLHIFQKKEIENYLVIPATILRFIKDKQRKGKPTLEIINKKIEEITDQMKFDIIDSFSSEIQKESKERDLKTCNQKARKIVNEHWKNIEDKMAIVPGKILIKNLSDWSKKEFGVSFNKFHLAEKLNCNEIDKEIRTVVEKIEKREKFI